MFDETRVAEIAPMENWSTFCRTSNRRRLSEKNFSSVVAHGREDVSSGVVGLKEDYKWSWIYCSYHQSHGDKRATIFGVRKACAARLS